MENNRIKKVYLVDSENVADLWVTHLMKLAEPEDEIVVFYTQKSPHMGYENLRKLLASEHEVEFVKCAEGQNALDFQLVTELGYRLGSVQEEIEYIVVTNDTGFDAAVKYWQYRGKMVKRYNAKYCHNLVNQKKQSGKIVGGTVQEDNKQTFTPVPTEQEAKTQENIPLTIQLLQELHEEDSKAESVSKEEIKETATEQKVETSVEQEEKKSKEDAGEALVREVVSCIGIDNIPDIHNALICLLGNQKGKQLYKQVKGKLNDYVPAGKMQIKNRFKTYCQLVFEHSEQKESCPKGFSKFVYDAEEKRKNLNSFRSALQNEYGKEKGMSYYTIMKPHVKILNRMQKA